MKQETKIKNFPQAIEEVEFKLEECIIVPIIYKYRKSDGKLVDRQALNPFAFFMIYADKFEAMMLDAFERWKKENG